MRQMPRRSPAEPTGGRGAVEVVPEAPPDQDSPCRYQVVALHGALGRVDSWIRTGWLRWKDRGTQDSQIHKDVVGREISRQGRSHPHLFLWLSFWLPGEIGV